MKYVKYALEYDPTDPTALTIHFNIALIEISTPPEKEIKAEATYESAVQGDNNTVVDDFEDGLKNGNKYILSPHLKMMGDTIYSLKGVRDLEICDYEIILVKSLFFEWKQIVDSVVATVLMFIEPDGKATEMPFNPGKNKKGWKTKEISWSFQEP